jgi:hypothetical protein
MVRDLKAVQAMELRENTQLRCLRSLVSWENAGSHSGEPAITYKDEVNDIDSGCRDVAALWRWEGGLVVGVAVEHAGVPAEDLVAEPLQVTRLTIPVVWALP